MVFQGNPDPVKLYTIDVKPENVPKEEYKFEDFKTLKVLGKGTFGKVLLV